MKLQGPDLSDNSRGENVALLHTELQRLGFTINAPEVRRKFFGEDTEKEVKAFQNLYCLPDDGTVALPTANAINKVVHLLDAGRNLVSGLVSSHDNRPLAGVEVALFDKVLRQEKRLGAAKTDSEGCFRIDYPAAALLYAGKRSYDLVVRVFNEYGNKIGASEVLYKAQPIARIDVEVEESALRPATYYESMIQRLAAPLAGINLADVTDEELVFLNKTIGGRAEHLQMIRDSARLARDIPLPAEAFYAWLWQNLGSSLEELQEREDEELIQALETACEKRIVSSEAVEPFEETVSRLKPTKMEPPVFGDDERDVVALVGRLVDEDGKPVEGLKVVVLGEDDEELSHDRSDKRGFVSLGKARVVEGEEGDPTIRLEIHEPLPDDEDNKRVVTFSLSELADSVPDISVRKPDEVDTSPTINKLAEISDITLTPKLQQRFDDRKCRTLSGLVRSGVLGELVSEMDDPESEMGEEERPAIEALQSHVELSTLSDDPQMCATLAKDGFASTADIAGVSRARFVSDTHAETGDARAAGMRASAAAQRNFFEQVRTWVAVEATRPDAGIAPEKLIRASGAHLKCGCEDCESAVSPLAYLADLLDYATEHLKNGDQPVSVEDLVSWFHQPFAELPASCEEMDRQVRQVRLCIEVLRRYMSAEGLDTDTEAEKAYRLNAYRALLTRIGTSLNEIRLIQNAAPDRRAALAERLGIELSQGDDRLEKMFFDPATGTDAVPEAGLEEIFGLVDTNRDPLAKPGTPLLRTWREERLRTLWRERDFPDDLPAGGRPVIDPDVIGPDDFRNPVRKTQASDPDRPFDIWIRRRQWVDDVLAAHTELKAPDAMIAYMSTPMSYNGLAEDVRAWEENIYDGFPKLLDDLTHGEAEDVAQARDRIEGELHLSTDGFVRLMALTEKGEKLSDEETAALVSILAGAQKRALFPIWIQEEEENQIREYAEVSESEGQKYRTQFGPGEFWPALTEPVEGQWPPPRMENLPAIDPRSAAHPLIDPDELTAKDLPNDTIGVLVDDDFENLPYDFFGVPALKAWRRRKRAVVEEIEDPLKDALQESVASACRIALDPEVSAEEIFQKLVDHLDELNSLRPPAGSEEAYDAKIIVIKNELCMTPEDLARLVELGRKAKRTESETTETLAILRNAMKVRRFYSDWIAEEETDGIVYWNALKSCLPKWRAAYQDRAEWRQCLRRRSRPSLVDPDLLFESDLRTPVEGDPLFDLFGHRQQILADLFKEMMAHHAEESEKQLQELKSMIEEHLVDSLVALKKINASREDGEDIEARLNQLSLQPDGFRRLMTLISLAEDEEQTIMPAEWEEASSILLQVHKRRETANWRLEEKMLEGKQFMLGPDHFVIPEVDWMRFPPPEPPELPAWRAHWTDRRDWQDTLQSRIDQHEAVAETLREAVSEAEAESLPQLRDALVEALGVDAKWVTDHLLIDAETAGCAQTTRISQAIETLQGILHAIRTAQLNDTHPDLELDADNFDEEWEWLGSYATWRAAMFVFLYPENILHPHLRRRQTPAFQELVKEIRAKRRLTPRQARQAAKVYEDYFADVTKLELGATCMTQTRMRRKGAEVGYAPIQYLFAHGGKTDAVYFSAYDPAEEPDFAQSFWTAVPGLDHVMSIVGAVPYESTPEKRFIYLFVKQRGEGKEKLAYLRYDLETQSWEQSPNELELPEGVVGYSAVVMQTRIEIHPPDVAIRTPNGVIYRRSMDLQGSDWAGDEWIPMVSTSKGADFQELCAHVRVDWRRSVMIARSDEGNFFYRILGDKDDCRWTRMQVYGESICGTFCGVIHWPGTRDLLVFFKPPVTSAGGGLDRFVVAGNVQYVPLKTGEAVCGYIEYDQISRIAYWLEETQNLDLAKVEIDGRNVLDAFRYFAEETQTPELLAYTHWDLARDFTDAIYNASWDDPFWGPWKMADHDVWLSTGQNGEKFPLGHVLARIVDGEKVGLKFRWPYELPKDPSQVREIYELGCIAPDSGWISDAGEAYQFAHNGRIIFRPGLYRCDLRLESEVLSVATSARAAPATSGSLSITETLGEQDLQVRRMWIEENYKNNEVPPRSNLIYLEEACFCVPVHLGLQLQNRGEYIAALDWFRTVYDYSAPDGPDGLRKIYYGLVREEDWERGFERVEDWLADPLDPHAIAQTRALTYTRFTLQALIRCLLAYADAEFTLDTAESVPRARTLYLTALELLDSGALKQSLGLCSDLIGQLQIDVGPAWRAVLLGLCKQLMRIRDRRQLEAAVKLAAKALCAEGSTAARFANANREVAPILEKAVQIRPLSKAVDNQSMAIRRAHRAFHAAPVVSTAARRVASAAGADTMRAISFVSGFARSAVEDRKDEMPWLRERATATVSAHPPVGTDPKLLRNARLRRKDPLAPTHVAVLTDLVEAAPIQGLKAVSKVPVVRAPRLVFDFCIPPNPALEMLRLRTELNLHKLRNCRNIAGMQRQLDPYSAPTDTVSGLPTIGESGQLVLPGLVKLSPTPYRYAVLIERCKQLVGLAQQVEATMLAAIEKADAERYSMLKARQDVRMAKAGVRLQDMRIREAQDGIMLAELQQEQAQLRADHFCQLIEEGHLDDEQTALNLLFVVEAAHCAAALFHGLAAAVNWRDSGYQESASASSSAAAAASTASTYYSTIASYERRAQEWAFQQALAEHDIRIGTQQVRLAKDRLRIVGQEHKIATLQADHAQATVDFLSNKFTNVELYDWMSDTLEGVYATMLQEATAMAQLASQQLAFERQVVPPPYIQADYWEPPDESMFMGSESEAKNRRGLTGSARLLQDVTLLDQHAFETDKRKLQLTKTISLLQLDPVAFQTFRETGVLTFTTPMELFDRDFPGHYLRLIKQVRTSVIALVPPTQGIRATLSTGGISRAVAGGDVFSRVVINHGPRSVALSSPQNSTGLFELDPQPQMLAPFEGLGVETTWELRMPKASNPIEYSTIADVLLTLEYTALESYDYRQMVLQSPALTRPLSSERPFSFRHQFADQWYALHNPVHNETPMTVRFGTRSEDYPPNQEKLKIQHITLFFSRKTGSNFEVPITRLEFTEEEAAGPVGGSAVTLSGIASTRGTAGSWAAMQGLSPVGEWELALPNTAEMHKRFKNEEIEDILFVITYSGRTPEWPR